MHETIECGLKSDLQLMIKAIYSVATMNFSRYQINIYFDENVVLRVKVD